MSDNKFDLIVLGGGPGGYSAAIRAAQLGAKVALIEKDNVGGTCLNRGCIPTKSILASIELYSKIKRAKEFGIDVEKFSINMYRVIERKNRIVTRLVKGVEYLLKQHKVELIKGDGIIKGPEKLEIRDSSAKGGSASGGKLEISAKRIILATGSEPMDIPGFQVDHKTIINSNDVLNLPEIPKTMEILGCGIIGLQFARIFSDLGTQVNICEALPKVLPAIDDEISSALIQSEKKRNIDIVLNTKLSKPSGKDITFVAAGRKLNTEGFEAAGVKLDRKRVVVNDKMETNLPGVYAVGDITGINMLAHVAYAQGKVAAENACKANSRIGLPSKIDYSVVPMCIFTDPEVAAVGLTEAEAQAKGIGIKIGKFPFAALGKARTIGEEEGFVKIIADAKSNKVLGVHIIGPQATILIAEAAMALRLEAKAQDIANLIHAHPTLPEAVQEAAESIFGQAIHI
jgi:dihydrolipoamide dehydrogenase